MYFDFAVLQIFICRKLLAVFIVEQYTGGAILYSALPGLLSFRNWGYKRVLVRWTVRPSSLVVNV